MILERTFFSAKNLYVRSVPDFLKMTLNREETLFHGMSMANSVFNFYGFRLRLQIPKWNLGVVSLGQTGNMNFAPIGCFKVLLPFMENKWVCG